MRRILSLVGLVCLALSSAMAQQSGQKPVVNKVATAKFVTVPSAPDCVTRAIERGDPSSGPAVFLFKFAPACAVPWHWHSPNEHVMIVGGTLQLEMKGEKPVSVGRSDFFFMPSHHIHRVKCLGAVPCTFFLYLDGVFDIHYVDEAGKEIPRDEALKGTKKAAQPKPAATKKKG